jgi:alpha-2-macroglobulin
MADEASFAWASALLEREGYPAAVTLARRLQARYPESLLLPSYEYIEGYGLFELRRYDDALGVLSRVAAGTYRRRDGSSGPSPNRDLCLFLAGQIHQARSELAEALELYRQVQGQFPEARELRDYYQRQVLSLPEVTTVLPGERVSVPLTVQNLEKVHLLVYRVDLLLLYLREKNLNDLTGIELTGIAPDHEETLPAGGGAEYRERELRVELPLREPGAYLVVARSGERDASGMMLLSELELRADEQAESGRVRLFLSNRSTGEPVGRAHVKVVGSRDGQFQSGDTDLRGLFAADGVQGRVTGIARSREAGRGDHYAFYRGAAELQPMRTPARPVFDRKSKALENLRRDLQEIQQQRVQDLEAIQFNEAQGVEAKKAY